GAACQGVAAVRRGGGERGADGARRRGCDGGLPAAALPRRTRAAGDEPGEPGIDGTFRRAWVTPPRAPRPPTLAPSGASPRRAARRSCGGGALVAVRRIGCGVGKGAFSPLCARRAHSPPRIF